MCWFFSQSLHYVARCLVWSAWGEGWAERREKSFRMDETSFWAGLSSGLLQAPLPSRPPCRGE